MFRFTRLWCAVVAVSLLSGAVSPAQERETPAKRTLDAFQVRFGDQALVRWDYGTGYVRHIWGAPLDMQATPRSAADFEALAREIFDYYGGMFGVTAGELERRVVQWLPFSRSGRTDKVAVVFDQVVGGLDVWDGSASVVFDTAGRVLSIDNKCLPDADLLDVVPSITRAAAHAIAAEHFGYGIEETFGIDYAIVPTDGAKLRLPAVAWVVHLRADVTNDGVPIQQMIAVDAHTGEVLWARSTVHTVDLFGNTQGWATPGLAPDGSSNPEQLFPLHLVRMDSPVGDADTLRNGDWTIPYGGTDAQVVIADFGSDNLIAYVDNVSGSELVVSQSVTPGVFSQFTFNTAKDEAGTAQVNGQYHVVNFRNYTRDVIGDNKMNFQQRCNVMLNNNCNAYYDYQSTNYFRAGSGCPNTAYTTVIAHETGHWANDRYGSGNGGDGFGEGNADNFAMFIYDTPIVGQDFFGPGSYVRSGLNTRQYCGSCGAGCYGEVHVDGEVLMGAFWKWRENLNVKYGDAQGDTLADQLFMGWMVSYDDTEICDIIEEHLLVLNDDDGIILNGTPDFAEIDAGFRAQGFPGIDLEQVYIQHTPVYEQQGDGASVAIQARAGSLTGTITTFRAYYSVNDGASFSYIDLTPTGSLDEYQGTLPAQVAPEAVYYYLYAQDSTGYSRVAPEGSPATDRYIYYVGTLYKLAEYAFDTGPTNDEGWTHSGTKQDDWQRGAPAGKSTDPNVAYSGTKVWGNDLGGGSWDGTYQNGNYLVLTSPAFDFSARTGARLQFRRWLGVEEGQDDQALVKVNGTTVWQNPAVGDLIDDHWTLQDIDISGPADGNSHVVVTFELVSDSSVVYGGWNLDDVRLLAVESGLPGDCTEPQNYGTGTAGSGGIVPHMTYAGGPPNIGNRYFALRCADALGGASGVFLVGFKTDSRVADGITYLVQTWIVFPVTFSGGAGVPGAGMADVGVPIPYNPWLAGLRFYSQAVVVDPGGPLGRSASEGLETVICLGY
ncbi:MAG: hypothetical protein AB1486_24665 [Planctomycetota bacterium]